MKTNILTASFLVLAAGAAFSLAQPAPNDAVLKGPDVKDGGVPGMRRPFGDGQPGDNKQRLADRPIPQMEFMRAVGALRDDTAADNVRLTEDQQKKIRAINQEFEQSMRSFREAHKADFEAMRGQFGDRGRPPRPSRPADAPNADAKNTPNGDQMAPPPPPTPRQGAPDGAARQRFEELRAQAPSPKDAQAQIFAVLTDAQKPIVQERLDTIKKEMAERGLEGKAREEVRRRLQKNGGPNGAAQGRFNPDNLPPKLQERLANMTPEEREQAIAKFRERAQNGGPGGPPGRPRPDRAAGGPPGPGPEALPPELKATWDSLTPDERQFLIQKLREHAAENGKPDGPPPRPRRRPPGDQPPPPPGE